MSNQKSKTKIIYIWKIGTPEFLALSHKGLIKIEVD